MKIEIILDTTPEIKISGKLTYTNNSFLIKDEPNDIVTKDYSISRIIAWDHVLLKIKEEIIFIIEEDNELDINPFILFIKDLYNTWGKSKYPKMKVMIESPYQLKDVQQLRYPRITPGGYVPNLSSVALRYIASSHPQQDSDIEKIVPEWSKFMVGNGFPRGGLAVYKEFNTAIDQDTRISIRMIKNRRPCQDGLLWVCKYYPDGFTLNEFKVKQDYPQISHLTWFMNMWTVTITQDWLDDLILFYKNNPEKYVSSENDPLEILSLIKYIKENNESLIPNKDHVLDIIKTYDESYDCFDLVEWLILCEVKISSLKEIQDLLLDIKDEMFIGDTDTLRLMPIEILRIPGYIKWVLDYCKLDELYDLSFHRHENYEERIALITDAGGVIIYD